MKDDTHHDNEAYGETEFAANAALSPSAGRVSQGIPVTDPKDGKPRRACGAMCAIGDWFVASDSDQLTSPGVRMSLWVRPVGDYFAEPKRAMYLCVHIPFVTPDGNPTNTTAWKRIL